MAATSLVSIVLEFRPDHSPAKQLLAELSYFWGIELLRQVSLCACVCGVCGECVADRHYLSYFDFNIAHPSPILSSLSLSGELPSSQSPFRRPSQSRRPHQNRFRIEVIATLEFFDRTFLRIFYFQPDGGAAQEAEWRHFRGDGGGLCGVFLFGTMDKERRNFRFFTFWECLHIFLLILLSFISFISKLSLSLQTVSVSKRAICVRCSFQMFDGKGVVRHGS